MNGSVKKETNGTWTYRVDKGTFNGQRKQHKKRGFRTKKEAETAMKEYMDQITANNYIDSKDMTLGEYLEHWLEAYAKIKVSNSTYLSYRSTVRYQLAMIGHYKLETLNPFIIQNLYAELLKEYSPTTVNYTHRILKMALKHAVRWKMIYANPAEAVDPPPKAHTEVETLTLEEIDILKKHLIKNNPEYYIVFMIAITTGMRRGEISALEWSDINFENNRISISKAIKLTEDGYIISTTKNKSSVRTVSMTKSLTDVLSTWHQTQRLNKVKYGQHYLENFMSKKMRDFICTWENGKAIYPSYYLVGLKKAIRDTGIEKHVRFHDLRHTHATLLLEQDVEAKIIQERLGHSNISTTMDLYSHVTRNTQDKAVQKLNTIL